MVPPSEVDSVDVHAAVVGPVVGQRNDELDVGLECCIDNLVQGGQVDGRSAVLVEPLKHDVVGLAGAIVGQSVLDVGAVLVVEAPCPKDRQSSGLGSCQPLFDVGLVLKGLLVDKTRHRDGT